METTDLETGVDPFAALMGALDDQPAAEATDPPAGEEEAAEPAAEQPEEPPNEAQSATVVDIDGKKLEIPEGTPPALVERVQSMAADLKADYTRKTQEVAEIRKASEARFDAIQKQEELLSANIDKVAELKILQSRIGQFEQLDWQTLADTDPAQATKLHIAYQALQREAGAKYREIQTAEQQRQQLSATEKEKARELARLELTKRLPTISDTDRRGMMKAAQDLGATESHIYDPVFLHALHKAAQWDRLQAEKPKAMQKVAAAPVVLKPGAAEQRKPNQAAFERLKKHGRTEDLAALL
jgi:hypothetical protein